MRMKKIAATILSGVMAVSLTACGGGDNKSGEGAKSAADDTGNEAAEAGRC